jgi:DNA-binding YbaB/EbfC family protein
MFKGMGDMAKMMKAATEMQDKMAQMQTDLERVTVTGESGAGLVRVTATAKGELTGLEIDPSILVASEKPVVEDLILAAIKDAQSRAAARSRQELEKMQESLGLPAGFKLPF